MSQFSNVVASGLFFVISALAPVSSVFARDIQGGVLTFKGMIVEPACSINKGAFAQAGQLKSDVLTGCGQPVSRQVTARLMGLQPNAVMRLDSVIPPLVIDNARVVLQLEYL